MDNICSLSGDFTSYWGNLYLLNTNLFPPGAFPVHDTSWQLQQQLHPSVAIKWLISKTVLSHSQWHYQRILGKSVTIERLKETSKGCVSRCHFSAYRRFSICEVSPKKVKNCREQWLWVSYKILKYRSTSLSNRKKGRVWCTASSLLWIIFR